MHDDDMPDDYVPDSVRIQQLEQEIAQLKARMDLLERQVREMDVTQLRIDSAVLAEKVESLVRRDLQTRDLLRGLTGLMMVTLAVASVNLALTWFGK